MYAVIHDALVLAVLAKFLLHEVWVHSDVKDSSAHIPRLREKRVLHLVHCRYHFSRFEELVKANRHYCERTEAGNHTTTSSRFGREITDADGFDLSSCE